MTVCFERGEGEEGGRGERERGGGGGERERERERGGGGERERGGRGEREREEINYVFDMTTLLLEMIKCPPLTSDEALFVPSDSNTLNSVFSCLRICK